MSCAPTSIDEFHSLEGAGTGARSLLEVMDSLPSTEGIDFEPTRLPGVVRGARYCAPLHVPDPRQYGDSLIAACAMEHGFTLVTRNVSDFSGMDLRLLNPWEEGRMESPPSRE